MFDLSWGEMGLIAMIALIVIGPKELPQVLRTVRSWLGAARQPSARSSRRSDAPITTQSASGLACSSVVSV